MTENLRPITFSTFEDTRHAIFTRHGGVSSAPWDSLNFGHLVGDTDENVDANFARACASLKVDPTHVASPFQVHGNRVWVVTRDNISFRKENADGIITRDSAVVLSMRFADCTPLLFFDPIAGAVGLGHAGWRGTMQNVVGAIVAAMRENFGSHPADIRLAIGPSIGACCYQVGDDVISAAKEVFPNADAFFNRENGDMRFDMWRANRHQAESAGIENITVSGICTACHTDDFFSHRAEKGKTGRFAAFIGLKGV